MHMFVYVCVSALTTAQKYTQKGYNYILLCFVFADSWAQILVWV